MFRAFIFSVFLILIFALPGSAQEKDSVAVYVRTRDGMEYSGYLEIQNSREIILRTPASGRITIPLSQVKAVREINPARINQEFLYTTAYYSRYYISSSAITLKKGDGYFNTSMLFFNRVEYGLADFWTIGAESFFMNGFATGITNRLQVPFNTGFFHLGVKGTMGISLDHGTIVGQVMGLATIGPVDRNVTIGIGASFVQDRTTTDPSYQVSGDFRIGRRGALLFDIHLIETGQNRLGFIMLGGRHRFRRVGLDYGFSIISDDNITPYVLPLPWFGLTVPF